MNKWPLKIDLGRDGAGRDGGGAKLDRRGGGSVSFWLPRPSLIDILQLQLLIFELELSKSC